jgi:hypothetical protein
MDGGRHVPSGRRVINGSAESGYRQPNAPQTQPVQAATLQNTPQRTAPSSQPVHQTSAKKPAASKRLKWPIIAVILVVLLAVAGYFGYSALQNQGTAIDSGKFQAVFFTNGQVYFGKLQSFNGDYMKLTDIFYLQTNSGAESQNPQEASADQSGVKLIKLGDEIHGPEDEMIISRDQMLFYENLKSDGKVSQSIQQYKSSN